MVSAGLALGQAANAAACIAAGLGAGLPGWAARPLRDVDGLQSFAISHLPIIILSANDAQMAALCDRLAHGAARRRRAGLSRTMRKASTTATPIGSATGNPRIAAAHGGHRTAGARRWINGLTGSLPML